MKWDNLPKISTQPFFDADLDSRVSGYNERVDRMLNARAKLEEQANTVRNTEPKEWDFDSDTLCAPVQSLLVTMIKEELTLREEFDALANDIRVAFDKAAEETREALDKMKRQVRKKLESIGYVSCPDSQFVIGKIFQGDIAKHPQVDELNKLAISYQNQACSHDTSNENRAAAQRLVAKIRGLQAVAAAI